MRETKFDLCAERRPYLSAQAFNTQVLQTGTRTQKAGTGRLDSEKAFSLASESMRKVDMWSSTDIPLSASTQKALHIIAHEETSALMPGFGLSIAAGTGRSSKNLEKFGDFDYGQN